MQEAEIHFPRLYNQKKFDGFLLHLTKSAQQLVTNFLDGPPEKFWLLPDNFRWLKWPISRYASL